MHVMNSFNHMQQEAKQIFATHGWPNKRNEEWHYTDLSARLPASFQNKSLELSEDVLIENLTRDIDEAYQLNFINGLLAEIEGLPDGLEISALIDHPELVQQSDEDITDPLLYANLAHLETGIVIDVTSAIKSHWRYIFTILPQKKPLLFVSFFALRVGRASRFWRVIAAGGIHSL